jgi:hypothetical protein
MPDPKRILIERPSGPTILAARHLDHTEGPVQVGRALTDSDRAAINMVLNYVSRAHNAAAGVPVTPADAPADAPRLFALHRDRDVTGISGTGLVADGVLWPDGSASIRWRGDRPSIVFWHDLDHAEQIHGHGGHTRLVFADDPVTGADAPADAPRVQLPNTLHARIFNAIGPAASPHHVIFSVRRRIADAVYQVVAEIERDRDEWRQRAVKDGELLAKAWEQRDEAREQLRDGQLAVEEARGAAGRLAEVLREIFARCDGSIFRPWSAQGFRVLQVGRDDYDRWRTVLETSAPRVNAPSPQASGVADAKPLTPADDTEQPGACPPDCAEQHTYENGCLLDPAQFPDDTGAISQGSGPSRDSWAWRCWGTDTCDGWLSLDHGSAAAARRAYDRHVRHKHGKPVPPGVGRTTLCCSRFRSQEKHAAHNWRGFAGSEAVYCPGWGWNLPDSMPPLPRRRALRPGLIRDLIDGARRGHTAAQAEAHHVAAAGLEAFPHDQDGDQA